MEKAKRIPYGVSNFVDVVERNQYYVDKTMYLPLLEDQPDSLFFIRPRRFGKSIFLSMLRAYYDLSQKDNFEKRFGNLWIGSHPTPLQGKYQVLFFDFSRANAGSRTLEENFNRYCCAVLNDFMRTYAGYYSEELQEEFFHTDSAADKLTKIDIEAKKNNYLLYLIIDEYDNFTNVVLNEQGNEVYQALTHASGFYRDHFKLYKGMFDRIFMTGVSPVTLDDLTSGFNIGWNISTDHRFNKMLGFSEEDVSEMLLYYKTAGELPADTDIEAMIEDMKPWYDNYCFAEESFKRDPKMFNCDMVLYYLRHYINLGGAPKQMIDPNTRTDYNKMKKLIQLDRLDGNRKGVLRKITEEGQIVTALTTTFPATEIANPEIFPSLLFYYGMLTIAGTRGPMLQLTIPNQVVREQLYGYLADAYRTAGHMNLDVDELNQLMYGMAYSREWESYFQYIATRLKEQSSIREFMEGEAHVKGFLLSYMGMNSYYITMPEYEMNKGFSDFYLIPNLPQLPDMPYSYAIEVKYCPRNAKDAEVEKLLEDAGIQLAQYVACPKVQEKKGTTEIIAIALVFRGWDLVKFKQIS